jgi:hypothetical protein
MFLRSLIEIIAMICVRQLDFGFFQLTSEMNLLGRTERAEQKAKVLSTATPVNGKISLLVLSLRDVD